MPVIKCLFKNVWTFDPPRPPYALASATAAPATLAGQPFAVLCAEDGPIRTRAAAGAGGPFEGARRWAVRLHCQV